MLGEEIFGEHFRAYLRVPRHEPRWPVQGYIMSSFGVGELGLHLCYETRATITSACAWPSGIPRSRATFSAPTPTMGLTLPMIFTFNPLRTFIEVVDPDDTGYGRMTTSMLDPTLDRAAAPLSDRRHRAPARRARK